MEHVWSPVWLYIEQVWSPVCLYQCCMTGGYQWLYVEQVWSPVWLLVLYDGWLSVAVCRTSVVTSVATSVV